VLDEAVLRRAAGNGARVRYGVMAKEMIDGPDDDPSGPSDPSIAIGTSDGVVRARRLVLATGKHEFKSVHERRGRDAGYVGFKMHLKLEPSASRRIADHCDLFVFDHGYGGLAPIGNGLANFCFLIEKNALRSIGTDWNALVAHVARGCRAASHYLEGAEFCFRRPVTVASVPYGFIRHALPPPGVFCVGDQMAVIPSLTGDGMTIALMTGARAADAIATGSSEPGRLRPPETAITYQAAMRAILRPQVNMGFHLHRLFRSPTMSDGSTRVMSVAPFLFRQIFARTRCPLEPIQVESSRVGLN